jgi:hypothetical protein
MPFADEATKNKGSLASAFSYKGKALRIQDVAPASGDVLFCASHHTRRSVGMRRQARRAEESRRAETERLAKEAEERQAKGLFSASRSAA